MNILVRGIFGENFQKIFFGQLDYCKCFAMKNSALERTKSVDYFLEGNKWVYHDFFKIYLEGSSKQSLIFGACLNWIWVSEAAWKSNLEYRCSRKSTLKVIKSYGKYLHSRIATVWKTSILTSILERTDSCIFCPVNLRSFFNLTITATWWS